jgi:hypothetical protein
MNPPAHLGTVHHPCPECARRGHAGPMTLLHLGDQLTRTCSSGPCWPACRAYASAYAAMRAHYGCADLRA